MMMMMMMIIIIIMVMVIIIFVRVFIELFQGSLFVCVLGSRFRPPYIPSSSNILADIFLANRVPSNVSQPRTLVCSVSFAVSILLQPIAVCMTRLL